MARPVQPVRRSRRSTVVVSQMGGLGDVVLVSHLISSLRGNFPKAKIVLICRSAFQPITDLFPHPPDETIGLDFSPYVWDVPSEPLYAALLERVIPQLTSIQGVEVFIAAEYQPTWLSWFVAALANPEKAVCATHARPPEAFVETVLRQFRLTMPEFDGPSPSQDIHELSRYAQIGEFLGEPQNSGRAWQLPKPLAAQARQHCKNLGLPDRDYLVCFPLGAAGVEVKRWPGERFIDTLNALRTEARLPVLLVGDQSERERLEQFAVGLSKTTGAAGIFTGSASSLPLLAGLLANAQGYLGNDTGPMHIASAYSVGGVAIYGGGHWPAYAPWGLGSVGIVHPLPCFHCNWDCLFGHGLCVESIPMTVVVEAMREALENKTAPARVRSLDLVPAATLNLIADANSRFRTANNDRRERLYSIIELSRDAADFEGRAVVAERAAKERLDALEMQNSALEKLRHEGRRHEEAIVDLTNLIEIRDASVEDFAHTAAERLKALELEHAARLKAETETQEAREGLIALNARAQELQSAADERLAALQEAGRIVASRDFRVAELEQTANERLAALQHAEEVLAARDSRVAELQQTADDRLAALQNAEEILAARDNRIAELEHTAAARLNALQHAEEVLAFRNRRLEELEKIAAERLAALRAAAGLLAIRESKLAELEKTAATRLTALQNAEEILAARDKRIVAAERTAGERLSALQEATRIVEARQKRILELESIATERLAALEKTTSAARLLEEESAKRVAALKHLTAVIVERDQTISRLETVAEERLQALMSTDKALQKWKGEAESRAQGLDELTKALKARDLTIRGLERTVQERLNALLETDAALQQVREEAARRLEGLDALTAIVHQRDTYISELEQTSAARLDALKAADGLLRELQIQSEARLSAMHELTRMVEMRDAEIAEMRSHARDLKEDALNRAARIEELTSVIGLRDTRLKEIAEELTSSQDQLSLAYASGAELAAAGEVLRARVDELAKQLETMERQRQDLQEQVIALTTESLYRYLLRRSKASHRDPEARSV